MKRDIQERTFNFGLRIINLSNHLPNTKAAKVLGRQVLRSGTSVGANVEEAEAAFSRDAFSYKINIALTEARETHYWLRMIRSSKLVKPERLTSLVQEADELKKILGAIAAKSRGKSRS